MLSVIFPFLIFLGNVNKVSSPIDKDCKWFCTITSKSNQTADKMEVWFNVSKRIDKECEANTLYRNLQNTTTTGYVFLLSSRKESDCRNEFSFMEFTTRTDLEHPFRREPMNKTAMKYVSCVLQPLSNQTEMAVSDGLDVLFSLRFHFSFNQSWKKPFVGYVNLEKKYHVSAGCSNGNVSEDYELPLTSVHHVFSWLFRIWYIIYFPLCLTFFCHSIKKIKRKRKNQYGRRRKLTITPEEANYHAGSAQEHDEGPIPAEEDVVEERMARSNDLSTNSANESVPLQRPLEGHSPGSPACDHWSEGIETDAASCLAIVASSATESEMDDDVEVIEVDGQASPVGIRSFVSNNIFLNKVNSKEAMWKKVCYCTAKVTCKFVILIMFPLSFLLWIDVFVFWIPRLFLQSSTNLPSPYLTKLVFTFAYKKYSVGIIVWFLVYGLRMLCICFKPSSKVCSIPDNIQENYQSFGWETLKRSWNYSPDSLVERKALLCLFSSITFLIMIVAELICSLPIVSLCYGGYWYTVDLVKNKFAKALVLFLEFVWICISIAWVAYISYCCSSSLLIAFKSLLISHMKYPNETLLSGAIYLITWHSIWKLYSHFTNIYFGILAKLFDICREHHRSEMKKYTVESKKCIPKVLFDRACNKFEPVWKNFKKLVLHFFVYKIILGFFFSIVFGTKYSKDVVLSAAVTFLIVLHPSMWDFLWKKDEEKTLKDLSMEEKLRDVVDEYFTE